MVSFSIQEKSIKYEIIAARDHWRLLHFFYVTRRLDRVHRAMSLVLGVLTLVSLGVLLAWNVNPKFFPIRAHGVLAAFPLDFGVAVEYEEDPVR